MAHDLIRQEAPAAQQELTLLKSMKVGDVRQDLLFPALDSEVEWTCVVANDPTWEFDGKFLGQPLFRVVIRSDASTGMLTLDVKE